MFAGFNHREINMKLNDLLDKKVLIWGYGLEGRSIVDLLLKRGQKNEILVATRDPLDEKIENVKFILESEILSKNFDVVIKSPGVSTYKNEIKILQEIGVLVTSTLNIFLAELEKYKNLKTIGITGTKGKSTTASICYHMLTTLGFKTALIGNIGISFFSIMDNLDKYDYLVMELSSYQLNNIMYKLDYGILLNLYPEHIDWHLTHENYFRDKLKILEYSRKYFVNYADSIANKYVKITKENSFSSKNTFHVENGYICYNNQKIFDINSLDNIKGEHIFINICSLLSVFENEKLDINRALESLDNFQTLNHRLEIFHNNKDNNTKFVDDSISTIPRATIMALKAFKYDNIFLVLGGFDRQQNYSELIKFLKNSNNIRKIFLLGQTGNKLRNEFDNANYFNSLEGLVLAIRNDNLDNVTVIFSPAAASFDMFKNFEDRGDKFKELMLR